MGLVLSNIFISGKIVATTEGSGIAQPPSSNVVTPVASFTKVTNLVGNLVNAIFTDTSTNNPTSWAWEFGDGGTSTLKNPTHLFETVGTFNTTVTATNAAGSNTSASQSITVLAPDLAPVASFTKTVASGTIPFSVSFTDTSINGPTSWAWDFGDGNTSTAQNPTHEYTTAGSFNVTLTATDAVGSNTSSAQSITASVPAPVSSFDMSVSFAGANGNLILGQFADTSTNSPTSWLWNFGDGTTSTAQNPVHLFETVGTFTITLTATNAAGSTTSAAQFVTVDAVKFLNRTSLLLNGNGTNASANNTFVDSSTNALAITRNGNTTQGSFSPFSPGGWSGYFPNVGSVVDVIQAPANTGFNFGAGEFTVEFWCNATTLRTGSGASFGYVYGQSQNLAVNNNRAHAVSVNATTLTFYYTVNGGADLNITWSYNFKASEWYHVAVVRVGNTINAYVNGQLLTSQAFTATIFSSTAALTVAGFGRYGIDNAYYGLSFAGSISNLRIVKGTAVYTANFTPSTTPLTAIAGTSLLTLQDNRFKDNSTNNFALTVTGTPKIAAASPFPMAEYSAASYGGSIYLDGAGDGINFPTISTSSTSFTIEGWVYLNSAATMQNLVNFYPHTTIGISLNRTGGGDTYVYIGNGGTWIGTPAIDSGANNPLIKNAWNHVALVRNSGTITLYHNGVSVGTTTTIPSGFSGGGTVGQIVDGGEHLSGYVADFRIVNGAAVYTTNFTPPTAPLTAISNTQLLLKGTNAGIVDLSGKNNLETVGNAQISTAQKKFGTGSMYFDGTGDSASVKGINNDFAFGTGNFTIEMWTKSASGGNLYDARPLTTNGAYANIQTASGNINYYVNSTAVIVSTVNINDNTWHHVAVCRSAGVTKLFIDGVQSGASYTDTNNYLNGVNRPIIGAQGWDGNSYFHNGYIDDLRVTKAALYTGNFTPPASQTSTMTDANDPYFNLVALELQANGANNANNNTFVDSSTNALAITRNGNATQGSFSPFSPAGWSGHFNGSTDVIVTPASAVFNVANNFTMECWFNANALAANNVLLCLCSTSTSLNSYVDLQITAAGAITYENFSNTSSQWAKTSAAGLVTAGQWYHIALVRAGTSFNVYLNGTVVPSSALTSSNVYNPTWAAQIGALLAPAMNAPFNGLISNVRYVSGTAVYTANFTPTTAPLTAIAGTALLTLQDNRFKDNSTNNFALTATGTPKIVANSPFPVTTAYSPAVNGGSMYFDGTGDYLTTPTNAAFNFATGDFTVEAWVFNANSSYAHGSLFASGTGSVTTLLQISAGGAVYLTNATGWNVASPLTVNYIGLNQWGHIAVTRQGTTVRTFINGVLKNTNTSSANFPGTLPLISNAVDGEALKNIYVSDLRVSKSAVYTSAFTPPTAPLTPIANTQLLLSGTNAAIYDASGHLPVETMGTAKLSTAQSKFGGSSMYFDGSSNCYAKLPAGSVKFGSSDYTIEFWYYKTAQAQAYARLFQMVDGDIISGISLCDHAGSLGYTNSTNGSTQDVSGWGGSLTLSTWHHIVHRRVGSVFSTYLNGVLVITTSVSINASIYYSATQVPVIGGQSGNRNITGYIDDFRITIGKGRYTVEPTAALTL